MHGAHGRATASSFAPPPNRHPAIQEVRNRAQSDHLHQRFCRNARGQRVNRLDYRQRVKIGLRQHVVGMGHLQLVAKPVNAAGNHAFFHTGARASASRPWHGRKQGQKSGVVLAGHAIGQTARRQHVFDNLNLKVAMRPLSTSARKGSRAVDQSGRQMPQQIDKLAACNFSSVTPSFGPMPGNVVASAKRAVGNIQSNFCLLPPGPVSCPNAFLVQTMTAFETRFITPQYRKIPPCQKPNRPASATRIPLSRYPRDGYCVGRFAEHVLDGLSDAGPDDYERILELPDDKLFSWATGANKCPKNCPALARCAFEPRPYEPTD